jgi:hypothetical protein
MNVTEAAQVTGFTEQFTSVRRMGEGDKIIHSQYEHGMCSGIPLTVVHLTLMGFERVIGDWFLMLKEKVAVPPVRVHVVEVVLGKAGQHGIYVHNMYDDKRNERVALRNNLRYVHELQNLFFFITGKELYLKL